MARSIVRLAEIHDQIGAVGVGGDLGPDAVEHRMRQPLGDLDGADGLQRLRRRAGEQRDPAADHAAVAEAGARYCSWPQLAMTRSRSRLRQ